MNVRALDGQPVIMEAVKVGNLQTLTMLIEAGANVNAIHNYKLDGSNESGTSRSRRMCRAAAQIRRQGQ